MGVAAVAQHMAEKAEPGQGVRQGAAVNGEQRAVRPAPGEIVGHQRQQGDQRKGEGHRGIVGNFHGGAVHIVAGHNGHLGVKIASRDVSTSGWQPL